MIPRILHTVWVGPRPFPEVFKKFRLTWMKHNPQWTFMFWGNNNLPELVNKDLIDSIKCPASKTDIIRCEVLYRYGGVYSDADSYCLKPLSPLIENLDCFSMTGREGLVANGTMGCSLNNHLFKEIVFGFKDHMSDIAEREKKGESFTIFHKAGCLYIHPILDGKDGFTQIDKGRIIGTRRLICAYGDKDISKAYINHKNTRIWEIGMRRVEHISKTYK